MQLLISTSGPKVTIPYLQKVLTTIREKSGWGGSSPAIRPIQSLIHSLDVFGDEPISVAEFYKLLQERGVDDEDMQIVKKAPKPRTAIKRVVNPMDLYMDLEKVSGKSLVLSGWPSDPTSDSKAANAVSQSMKVLLKAIPGIKKYKRAWAMWNKDVKKLQLSWQKGHRTEDASWNPGGVMDVIVGKQKDTISVLKSRLVHELGHTLEDRSQTIMTPHNSVYGNPPFVSQYATMNATEDFAETFRAFEMEPRNLKRLAPEKFQDMLQRCKDARL